MSYKFREVRGALSRRIGDTCKYNGNVTVRHCSPFQTQISSIAAVNDGLLVWLWSTRNQAVNRRGEVAGVQLVNLVVAKGDEKLLSTKRPDD